MKHARFPVKGTRAPVHALPSVVVYSLPQEIVWIVERFFFTRRDGTIGLGAGREHARVSSRTVAVNLGRRLAERHGVKLTIVPEPIELWPRKGFPPKLAPQQALRHRKRSDEGGV